MWILWPMCSRLKDPEVSRRSASTKITKWQIAYVPLDLVADYIHMLNLNTRLRVGWKTQRRFLFGDSSLLLLVPRNYFRWDLCWNFPAGASELIPFGARSDRLWDLRSPEIPSQGLLPVFPRLGLPWLFVCEELYFPPLGVYCSSPLLGKSINHQITDFLRSLWPSCWQHTYVKLKH